MSRARLQVERTPSDAETVSVPAGAPAWITPELIRLTIKVWQPRYKAQLTADDAVTIIRNAGQLLDVFSRE